jgi:predicted acylesterase/phospholipase RssA
MNRRGLLAFLFRDSMANLVPLERLLARHLGPEELRRIAAEHRRGRRLFIGTTHLDAGRPVIWNIGAIAASGRPDALQLIHHILVASASIPGAFEPAYFEVEADGRRYDEMHVDGGATAQVFLFPAQFDWRQMAEIIEPPRPARIYVIRNSTLAPEFEPVKPRALAISARSVAALIRT